MVQTIKGEAATRHVYIGRKRLSLRRSKREVFDCDVKSFSWGNAGPGASQLAAAILLEFVDVLSAVRMYQRFKFDVLYSLNKARDFALSTQDVYKWICTCNARDAAVSTFDIDVDDLVADPSCLLTHSDTPVTIPEIDREVDADADYT